MTPLQQQLTKVTGEQLSAVLTKRLQHFTMIMGTKNVSQDRINEIALRRNEIMNIIQKLEN